MARELSFVTVIGYHAYHELWRVWSIDGKYWGYLTPKEQEAFKAKLDEMNALLKWFSDFRKQRLESK